MKRFAVTALLAGGMLLPGLALTADPASADRGRSYRRSHRGHRAHRAHRGHYNRWRPSHSGRRHYRPRHYYGRDRGFGLRDLFFGAALGYGAYRLYDYLD